MLWIGVHLPSLSLETFLATLAPLVPSSDASHDADADPSPADPLGPAALVARHRIVDANAAARAQGVEPGQKRATALGLAPATRLGEADAARDDAALGAVAHALLAFTPAVSIAPGHVVLAEVQASLRYFGGLERLLARLRAALAPLGHRLRVARAPTPQAAQWLAAWRDEQHSPPSGGDGWRSPPPGDNGRHAPPPDDPAGWQALLDRLPVARVAAATPHLAALETLGLACVADLRRQPRAGLVRRFGGELLTEIDRAFGTLADPRTPLAPPPEFEGRLELFTRADDSAALMTGAAVLLERLAAWAAACHGRIAGFTLRLHHETRLRARQDDPGAATTTLSIGLGEPVADTAHLHVLLRERLQRQPLAASVIELGLHCDALQPGAPPNAELFPSAASEGEGWQRLLERLEARLGAHNLQCLEAVADHRPEHATRVRPPGARPRAAGAAGTPLAIGMACGTGPGPGTEGDPADWPRLRRPVWLLAEPQPLREQGGTPLLGGAPLWLVAGPERIETAWWEAEDVQRDYFIAQSEDGALLWIYRFRRAPAAGVAGWYLQGRFG